MSVRRVFRACLIGMMSLAAVDVAGVCRAEPPAAADPASETARRKTITISSAGQTISESCVVVIPPELVLPGGEGGALRITGDDLVVEFADGSVLRGAASGTRPDTMSGVGLVISGRSVTLKGFRAQGYKVALHGEGVDGLTIDGAVVTDLWRMRLKSTPQAEHLSDWLWPHKNDEGQWRRDYGGAVSVKDSSNVTIRDVVVRRSQNGILLDRVRGSKVYDCDCSFLSGWGLALWRSEGNVISRNALDFNIRGFSPGVYDRGQDSAGIVMFEKCSRNVIVENSMTHCGDGIFSFCGRESLGDDLPPDVKPTPEQLEARKRAGCNDNVIVGNDLSHNVVHGIELTFSFGNTIAHNRFVGNGITGCWLGYSADTRVLHNVFERNGGYRSKADGGGVLIDHGRRNLIAGNTFEKCTNAVWLWADHPAKLEQTPWGQANAEPDDAADPGSVSTIRSADNVVAHNRFIENTSAVKLKNTRRTRYAENVMTGGGVQLAIEDGDEVSRGLDRTACDLPGKIDDAKQAVGGRTPIGARKHRGERDAIVVGRWGPWDFESTLLRVARQSGRQATYEIFGVTSPIDAKVIEGDVDIRVTPASEWASTGKGSTSRATVEITARRPGVTPWQVALKGEKIDRRLSGTFVAADFGVRVWAFDADPMKDLDKWRAEAQQVAPVAMDRLDFAFAYAGPAAVPELKAMATAGKIGRAKYGLTAEGELALQPGAWKLSVTSDDGVRVFVDDRPIIERWDIHVPTTDTYTIQVDKARRVPVRVEYFQMDGFATLKVDVELAGHPSPAND